MAINPMEDHLVVTRRLARELKWTHVYHWLVEHGYFPESYVLPPCFRVTKHPGKPRLYHKVTKKGDLRLPVHQCCDAHFPKSDLTDRSFGVMHPELHNDIAYHLARNWKTTVDYLLPKDSDVMSYSFPVPIDSKHPGRVGRLRSGRLIYEYLWMTEEDVASVAYRYTHLVRTDIKSFYPSIYTHSIAWAIHGKAKIRKEGNRNDCRLLGNRLDRLFQYSNDQRTNGIPIGPVVSDIVAEIIAAAIDRRLSAAVKEAGIECAMTRFKDDYRFLVKSEAEGRQMLKMLQSALSEFNLELGESKTAITVLPEGLFRPWVSQYHAVYPRPKRSFTWKEFKELYLAVLRIDEACPGTGVIDRFLADIVAKEHRLKVRLSGRTLQKAMSMLLLLGARRIKAFPKIIAIVESVLRSPFGALHTDEIVGYLQQHLATLARDEARNKYLISWIAYFFMSNGLRDKLGAEPQFSDPVTRSIVSNRQTIFRACADFKLFEGSKSAGRRASMLEYLDVFNPAMPT